MRSSPFDTSVRWGAAWIGTALVAGTLVIGSPAGAASGLAVPGAPRVTAATAGLHSVTVQFDATTTGGAPISGYRVTCTSHSGGPTGTHQGFSSPVTVPSLASNQSYTCTVAAINRVGIGPASAPSKAVVTLPTVPGPPVITSMTPGWHAVTITFKPTTDGGARVSNYSVSCSIGYGSRRHNGFSSPVTIACAQGGEPYHCTVAAENRVGWGHASSVAGPTLSLPVAPGPPTITSATAGHASVSVAFAPPTNTGGAHIDSYRVTCTSSNGGATNSHQGPASPIAVAGLSAGKTYTCVVTAHNQVALGAPSAPSAPTIPLSP